MTTPPHLARPRNVTDWRDQANLVGTFALDGPWLIGDWLNAAERLDVKDDATRLLNADRRWEATTVARWQYVAERFPPSKRRRKVPWQFYSVVADLPWPVADNLLATSAAEDWTLAQVKTAASKAKPTAKAAAKKPTKKAAT